MRSICLHIFSLIFSLLYLSQGIFSQATNGIVSVSGTMSQKHTSLPASAFFGQKNYPVNCCGYQSGSNTVTIEKENIPLSTVITQIGIFDYDGSLKTYTGHGSNNTSNHIPVNVYMVYLNDPLDLRSTPGYVNFEGEIVGVYVQKTKTISWSSSDFASSYYPASNVPGGRTLEPTNWNNGSYHSSWVNSSAADYFQVTNSYKRFTIGCNNGKPGDFFRVVTISNSCSEPTGAGSIGNPQSNCGSFNPSAITNSSSGSGGSGGTATYFWQKSTTSNSSNFSTISGATSTTYNPPSTISQTTWYI